MQIDVIRKLIHRFKKPAATPQWSDRFPELLDKDNLIFNPNLSAEEKMALFKKNINLVEFEPNSYCNRTCSFCPNSFLDRVTKKEGLDRTLFTQTIEQLASIDYDKTIRFARYSEPLAYADALCEMIAIARKNLPKANIDIVSNGDYLKPKTLEALRNAGLSVLRISIYPDTKDKTWTKDAAIKKMEALGKRIGIEPSGVTQYEDSVNCKFVYPGLPIEAWSHNFEQVGFDRGESMEKLIDKEFVRKSPCIFVFSNFTIEYDGTVMPCCNLRSDHKDHEKYIIDKLKPNDTRTIFDVFAGKVYSEWKRSLARVDDKDSPCRTCKQKAVTDENMLNDLGRKIDARLTQVGVPVKG